MDDQPNTVEELAAIARQRVLIQSATASRIRALGAPPSREAAQAIVAFEQKIEFERRASEAGAKGGRDAWAEIMRRSTLPANEARQALLTLGPQHAAH